jgi:predicted nucleic acid-binding protein
MNGTLLDAGLLVAHLFSRDAYHDWATEQFAASQSRFLTCEAVLTEACFLVSRYGQPPTHVLVLLERGVIEIGLDIEDEFKVVRALMARYANVPMSLANACLVRMAEMTRLPICTLDADFAVYRAHGRQPLDLISPAGFHGLHELRAGSPLAVKSVEVMPEIMTVVAPDPEGSSAPTVWTASRHSLFGWTDWTM